MESGYLNCVFQIRKMHLSFSTRTSSNSFLIFPLKPRRADSTSVIKQGVSAIVGLITFYISTGFHKKCLPFQT